MYPQYTLESDLFFFWGLIVQICECWAVNTSEIPTGCTVTPTFEQIYTDPLKVNALQKLFDANCPLGDEFSAVLGFYVNTVSGLERCSIPDKEKHFHMLRTLRNSFGHARFDYQLNKLSTLLASCEPSLTFAGFTPVLPMIMDKDQPTEEREAYLVVLTDWVPKKMNTLRVIITKQFHLLYYLYEFLTAVLHVAHSADVFNY